MMQCKMADSCDRDQCRHKAPHEKDAACHHYCGWPDVSGACQCVEVDQYVCPNVIKCAVDTCLHRSVHTHLESCNDCPPCPACVKVELPKEKNKVAKKEKKLTNKIEKPMLCPKHETCDIDDTCRHRAVHECDNVCAEDTGLCPSCVPQSEILPVNTPRNIEMTERKLKVRLVLFDRAVAMQVLYQDTRFLNRGDGIYCNYRAYNGVCIISDESPNLAQYDGGDTDVYLRGRADEEDTKIACIYFDSNKERDDYVKRLKEALRDWSENAPEFGKKAVKRVEEVIQEDEVFEL